MSRLRSFVSNLSTAQSTFLFCTAIGAFFLIGSVVAGGGPNVLFGMTAFGTWIVIGLFFGAIVWVVDTLSLWRSSLTRRSEADRDLALQALKERYACGELDENLFETMLRRLRET